MASTEFLSHWPFLLGLLLLLEVSAGIWYNLNDIAKRFPQLISSPQRWLAAFAVTLLAASVGILGFEVVSQSHVTGGLAWTPLRWSSIAVAGRGMELEKLSPTALKKFATGDGKADKETMWEHASMQGYSGPKQDDIVDAWHLYQYGKRLKDAA